MNTIYAEAMKTSFPLLQKFSHAVRRLLLATEKRLKVEEMPLVRTSVTALQFCFFLSLFNGGFSVAQEKRITVNE
jgi:hypothetical protein